MAPRTPAKKKATVTAHAPKKDDDGLPAVSTAINYDEEQDNELQVLKAIFMDDFEEVEVKTAWSKTTDRSFKLKIRSLTDAESFVILAVRLTATYPKTLPVLDMLGLEGYHERTQRRIRSIVENRPKQLLGSVMIHDIANEIQDALEDAVQARQQGTLPSLNEERASAEEVAAALAKQAEEAKIRRQQEAQYEEDRVLKQLVNEEISRREERKSVKSLYNESHRPNASSDLDTISFDQSASMQIDGDVAHFNEVVVVSSTERSRGQQTLLAKPKIFQSRSSNLVAVKRIAFHKDREEVLELESVLSKLLLLRHSNILSIFAYRIDKLDDLRSQLVLCHENGDRGTLADLLLLSSLHTSQARHFTVQMLEALEYLHSKGLAHGSISSQSVALVSSPAITPKLTDFGYTSISPTRTETPTRWRVPEGTNSSSLLQRKSDIWQFGTVVAQMFLGLETPNQYSSPQLLFARLDLSESFADFLSRMFTIDAKRRPSAFDLLPAEFLRTDNAVMESPETSVQSPLRNVGWRGSDGPPSAAKRRSRHNSSNVLEPLSRYATDFTEIGRLGKGGFGEVVKARNKLDGGVYAVKKIKQAPQLLDQVISEVMLLNRLNHPYVVRYFSTWVEEDSTGTIHDGSTTTTTETATGTETAAEDSSDGPRMEFGYQSTGGLDFVSSSGFPQIEFGDDSAEDSSEDDVSGRYQAVNCSPARANPAESSAVGNLILRKSRSDSKRPPSTLYIQMEYCERHTLRDLIRKEMSIDDTWGYVRQITEGLAHIHGHGIIHRDLKPDNIFIDVAGNPKIGDFGLATTSQYHFIERPAAMSGQSAGDMTRSVGTTLYVAPELRSASGTSYSDKVDMYSLGIMFYEMCEPFETAMERIRALQSIRGRDHELPPAYQSNGKKAAQGKLISCLISHKPSERPTSTELLRSDILPVKIESETVRQALSGLSDPKSPYHQKLMSALFTPDSVNTNRVKALAWDSRIPASIDDRDRLRLRGVARQTLETIFRRHGAEEARRQGVFPRSGYYTNANVVQLLDASGNFLQLPYDLTLPHARQLARQPSNVRCTFAFGSAYRDAFTGGPPRVNEEVDFDIADWGSADERTMNDAEVIKVMDEVLGEMPLFASSTTTCFHLNHAVILGAILDHCRVPTAQQPAVKEIISRLGFNQYNWSKVRVELRKFGLPDTTLDDLQQFDFRDPPDKAFARLNTLLATSHPRVRAKLEPGIVSLSEIIGLVTLFDLQRKVYLSPLGSVNAKFYEDGLLFQCVLERKSNRVVIAAGGRYDSLIRAHRPIDVHTKAQGAVGVSIGLDPIVTNMGRHSEASAKRAYLKDRRRQEKTPKRCDALVSASGTEAVRKAGLKLLSSLWAYDISAELATNRISHDEEHSFVITLRHEGSSTAKVLNTESQGEEVDIPLSALVTHLQQELREQEGTKMRQPALLRQQSQPETERKTNVQVLMARHGSKKSNKYHIVNDAQSQWSQKLDEMKEAPILAVETRDEVLDLIRQTRLSDAESWRRAAQSVQLNDRQYVQQIQEKLSSWRRDWTEGEGFREACLFNFRTQYCIYYDLGQ